MDPGSAYYDDVGGGFAPSEVIIICRSRIQDQVVVAVAVAVVVAVAVAVADRSATGSRNRSGLVFDLISGSVLFFRSNGSDEHRRTDDGRTD